MHPPVDLVGFFITIVNLVKTIDPLVDLVVQHDEKYDALMTNFFMNSLHRIDQDLAMKVSELLNLEEPEHRKLLVSLVKRFVHSLGFEFLNMRNTLFFWDQLLMKVYPMGIEIFLVMALTFLCLKDEILKIETWDKFLDFYYQNSKLIEFRDFSHLYKESFSAFYFYNPVYENAEVSEVVYSDVEDSAEAEKSQVIDLSKKPPAQVKRPKIHSTLLAQPQKDDVLGAEIKRLDPQIERALHENVESQGARQKHQIGMVPFINIAEEEPDELDDL